MPKYYDENNIYNHKNYLEEQHCQNTSSAQSRCFPDIISRCPFNKSYAPSSRPYRETTDNSGTPRLLGPLAPTGPVESPRPIGPSGRIGTIDDTRPASSESIIPLTSGLPITLTTMIGGLVGTPAFLGFGSSAPGTSIVENTINLTNATGTLTNFAFPVPRDGTITSFSTFFSTTLALSLIGSSVTIHANIFASSTPDNLFESILSVPLEPALTNTPAIGTISTVSATDLRIPITSGTRLLVVFTSSATGLSLVQTIEGYASAGISIS